MIKISRKRIFMLFLFSIPNTIFSFLMLHIINSVVTDGVSIIKEYKGIAFFLLAILSYIFTLIFQKKLIYLSKTFVYDNELKIFQALQKTSLSKIEKLGTERVYSIVEDIRVYIFLPDTMVTALNSFLTLLVYIGYLIYISSFSTIIIVILLISMITCHIIVGKKLSKKVEEIKKYNDKYFKFVEDAIKGFKQFKISKAKTQNLYKKFLKPNREAAKTKDIILSNNFVGVNLLSQYGLYFILGTILFVLPALNILEKDKINSFLVVFLFILGPIMTLLSTQEFFTRIFTAEKRIKDFFNDFTEEKELNITPKIHDFEKLEIKDLYFEYNNNENGFTLESINFSVNKGEVIFIVGGNGSGKTTFMNVLSGLYKPTNGQVLLNNEVVDNNDSNYKDIFSIVFSDSHLFSENYNDFSLSRNNKFSDFLTLMKLKNIIKYNNEDFSIPPLSSGQTKRMLLIMSLLEGTPVILLDEWAAEQDPFFRNYFYKTLLPMLKEEGKTIIAITHDDEYFDIADRVIKFEYGKIL
ncbi:ATP-binding cassette domain-containing protein [Chryseobacterium gambrini]|uniref:ATP-binding cassette domain-containing protein n=1 Tax=Chryseobacterium gambrini TaxID=373672 RepID=UPI003BA3FC83